MQIIVPQFGGMTMGKRLKLEQELAWGTYVQDYFAKEKALYMERALAIAKKEKYFQQNKKSEFRKDFVVDSRTYMRWLKEDPYFWHDKGNVKRFKEQNPECVPWD